MSTRFLTRVDTLAEILSLPADAGVGVLGGQAYLNAGGAPVPLGSILTIAGTVRMVNPAQATDINSIYATIQDAVDACVAGDVILVAPGAYDETVTIGRTDADGAALNNLKIIGVGGRGACFIEPSTEDAGGLVCHADDVTIYNLGIAAEDETSAVALTVTGSRFRAYGCKIEGGADQVVIGPGTVAQEAAGTRGTGSDARFVDCEICWGTDGIILTSSDYGAVTQCQILGCHFHNLTGVELGENDVPGSGVCVRDARVEGCTFANQEDGTEPSKFLELDTAGDTGFVGGNMFANPTNATAQIAIAAGVLYGPNGTEAGWSTARPA